MDCMLSSLYFDKAALIMRPVLTTSQGICSKFCMRFASMLSFHKIGQSECHSMPQGGKVVDKVEGADAAAVARMVQKHCPQLEASSQKAGSIAPPAAISNGTALHAQAANGGQSLEQRVNELMNKQPVMLFMKVSPLVIHADMSMP